MGNICTQGQLPLDNMETGMKRTLSTAIAATLMACACGHAAADAAHPKIGFSIDDLRVERWTRDREYFTSAAEGLGATVVVASADANDKRQLEQIQGMIDSGVDVLVVVPANATVLGRAMRAARRANIKIVSYDRLIMNADIDAYISFDNKQVGEMQAASLVEVKPKGNYYLLGGSPTDNNARVLREGQLKVLQPFIDKGDIKVVGKQWVKEWSPVEAKAIVDKALGTLDNKVDAVVASNDGTAGGTILALQAQGMAGKVAVSGQDADIAAVKRVVAGAQTMTVYKSLRMMATEAAKLAVQLVRKEKPAFNGAYDNGFKQVDSVLLKPVSITKTTVDTMVKDGFYTRAQIGL
jgi:D-xylose transport system substrate-binding protein